MNCNSCGRKLERELYFCRACFMLLPAKERVSLFGMHHRGQNTDSKVAKCVRILKDARTKEEHLAR